MTSSHCRAVTAVIVAVATSACATTSKPVASPTGRDAAIAAARADSARKPYTEADIRFMSAMIAHHAQAIDIARWAPTHGASRPLQILSERVINAQRDEIALMQQWLRERQLPVPDPSAPMAMGGAGHAHHHMPGMLTPEQLQQLDQARGKEFDRLFLTFMIQHHQGAVTMVKELASSPGAGLDDTVFKLASDISADQTSEIDRMQQMLAELMFGPPSP
ncbi:MAG TPA: DUF305 domain-containing protein [Gemmatimonadaceae bacterium]|nr:DUF305 domain-containing protein [Gemmatimonadaceae bacterium]